MFTISGVGSLVVVHVTLFLVWGHGVQLAGTGSSQNAVVDKGMSRNEESFSTYC